MNFEFAWFVSEVFSNPILLVTVLLTLGVIFGTWSSVFVAAPILIAFGDVDLYQNKANKKDDFERPGEHGIV